MAVNGGDGQSATAGAAVATAPSVLIRDVNNNPVSGVSVTFAVTTGGGSLGASGTVSTDANGIATSPAWTLGTTVGPNTLTASSTGLTDVIFNATGTVGAPTQISITAGDGQSVPAGTDVTPPLTVIVRDGNNNPVAGVDVTFAIATGAGSLTGATVVQTGVDGTAVAPAWTLDVVPGQNTMTATATGVATPATFTATGT
jgi:adhesin/invasin